MKTSTKKNDSAATPEVAEPAKRMPLRTIRDDDCSVSIWSREHDVQGEPTTFYSLTFERSYTTKDGVRKWTTSFSPEDAVKVIGLAQRADLMIAELRKAQ